MNNNYVRLGVGKDAEVYFFNDAEFAERKKAYHLADITANMLDRTQKPPALVGVSVYRRLAEYPDVLEIGEVRARQNIAVVPS